MKISIQRGECIMAFGVKQVKLKLNGTYTIEELFDRIKDSDFGDAGQPQLGSTIPKGKPNVIYFPKIDRNNQVWIIKNLRGGYTVQRSTGIVGGMVKNMVKDDVLDAVTGGFAGMFSNLGSPMKKCEKDVDHVVEVIEGLGL